MIDTYFVCGIMVKEIESLSGLKVYTKEGVFVGKVDNVALDLPNRSVRGILLSGTNPGLIEGGRSVLVPYRWITSVGDIIILSFFPQKVKAPRGMEEEKQ